MPRYLVERHFPEGLNLPVNLVGIKSVRGIIDRNAAEGVTWVHSYVSEDKKTTFCIYDGPDPDAIRRTAAKNGLPADRITEVRVLDPYFYS